MANMKRLTWRLFGVLVCGHAICLAAEVRTPVLLELFTSEGCSSCPPADQLLTKLDREQPFKDVDLIVIGEHVDYFNGDGWNDRYSSRAFTERQQSYSSWLHSDDPFTPQLVVDGSRQVVGSNWPKAKAAIEAARQAQKLMVSLQAHSLGNKNSVTVTIAADSHIPAGAVYLVLAADAMESEVKGGENSGRHLTHTAVAYSFTKIGRTQRQGPFEKTVAVPLRLKWGGGIRAIVLVQDPDSGRILGASQAKF